VATPFMEYVRMHARSALLLLAAYSFLARSLLLPNNHQHPRRVRAYVRMRSASPIILVACSAEFFHPLIPVLPRRTYRSIRRRAAGMHGMLVYRLMGRREAAFQRHRRVAK
jgi:hypothetical protein